MAPVVSGNIFNLFYGTVFDAHSIVEPDGNRSCEEGLMCYQQAYYVTLLSSVLGIAVCLWGYKGSVRGRGRCWRSTRDIVMRRGRFSLLDLMLILNGFVYQSETLPLPLCL